MAEPVGVYAHIYVVHTLNTYVSFGNTSWRSEISICNMFELLFSAMPFSAYAEIATKAT